ncbi:MAG: hypothetical protein GEV11_14680 [Streptosporangiales bacterium]|nr:hypothetical protein [Streptosporangiales bacterium]
MAAIGGAERRVFAAAGRSLVTGVTVARLNFAGSAIGVLFFCLSLTPSLLPRGWLMQGLVSGILAATGYLVGVTIGFLVRHGGRLAGRVLRAHAMPAHVLSARARPATERLRELAWPVLGGLSALLVPISMYRGTVWQSEIHRTIGLEPPSATSYLAVPVVTGVLFTVLIALVRALRSAVVRLGRFLGRWIPVLLAKAVATVAVTALFLASLNGLVADVLMRGANNSFAAVNSELNPGVAPPANPMVSGSVSSLVSWASLGRQGRRFVTEGPRPEQLRAFSGAAPVNPARVYVGLDSAPSVTERATLAVRELERTGAFEREAICLITTTGTGWVDSDSVDPLEYLYNGDTALAAIQYSYLPSWLSFVVDQDRARAAAEELFEQVHARWSRIPEEKRPKLFVFGESLGALGAESVFGDLDDIRTRTDGMLLVGPPESSVLRRELIANRDYGSTETRPVYQDGRTVRFADRGSDLARPYAPWEFPRVVYLQHASDPIVWWSPRLMLHRPDWLEEPRGDNVLPNFQWYPFVTFWQLTADMVFSVQMPPGIGHDYGAEAADAWGEIAAPEGWTPARAAALRAQFGG